MHFPTRLIAPAAFVGALALSILAAAWMALAVESRTSAEVKGLLTREGLSWTDVRVDGLQVRLYGTAPNEAQRFRAMNLVGTLVDAGRIRDLMEVTPAQAIEPPRFSVELLRNDDGISIIGLVPSEEREIALADEVRNIAGNAAVADMLEQAEFPAPAGWDGAIEFGLEALRLLPRSKISISAERVSITAISGSEDERRRLEAELARARPDTVTLEMDISAPRPVLTPFTLRFLVDDRGARFDACSADTEQARTRILAAAVEAGMAGKADCTIGLGVPTPRWSEATALGIKAVAELGGGTITFSDADVSLEATIDTSQATFDRVVGELQAALPDVFSLNATLPEKPKASAPEGPAEFTASLSPEGAVQLRGRLTDAQLRDAVSSFARAEFGAANVYTATRLDPELPDGWPIRVLAGLDALATLTEGNLTVRADTVEINGVTGSPQARSEITRILSARLGQGQTFKVDVRYDEAQDPLAALPTPEECVADLNAVLAKGKIAFAPGSAEIEAEARTTMNALADILRNCPDVQMEIAGHTDSQGSEGGNLALSQARAEAVLLDLQGRRVLVGSLTAKGYGESTPIADNETEAGREANRRIEFTLIGGTAETTAAAVPIVTGEQVAPATPAANPSPPEPAAQAEPGVEASTPSVPEGQAAPSGSAPAQDEAADASGGEAGPAPADPEAPFVSAAPQEKTQRPPRRPEND